MLLTISYYRFVLVRSDNYDAIGSAMRCIGVCVRLTKLNYGEELLGHFVFVCFVCICVCLVFTVPGNLPDACMIITFIIPPPPPPPPTHSPQNMMLYTIVVFYTLTTPITLPGLLNQM